MALAVVGLVGSAMTAVAVAPLVNDAPVLQRLVSESVQMPDISAQVDDLAAADLTLNRNEITRATDSAESLLKRLGVLDPGAAAFLRTDPAARQLLVGRGGKMVQAQFDGQGRLQQLVARYPIEQAELAKTHFARLTLARTGGRWQAHPSIAPYGTEMRLGSGIVRSNLYAATDAAGLPSTVAEQLTEIFATDIDFHHQLRQGDSFSVVYEAPTADGEPVPWSDSTGRVAAAEFVNAGKSYQAIWFTASDGRSGYYGIDGRSKKRAFLASPMEFSRITSGFSGRINPFTQAWQHHQGIDYAAPKGTPVRSVADGTVVFSGVRSGYGNAVEIDHGNGRTTFYAHLSRIDMRKGQRIAQGQTVGAVGSTGMATGPHLHFEYRMGGVYQNPLMVAKATETTPLDSAARARFKESVQTVLARLDVAESLAARRPRVE